MTDVENMYRVLPDAALYSISKLHSEWVNIEKAMPLRTLKEKVDLSAPELKIEVRTSREGEVVGFKITHSEMVRRKQLWMDLDYTGFYGPKIVLRVSVQLEKAWKLFVPAWTQVIGAAVNTLDKYFKDVDPRKIELCIEYCQGSTPDCFDYYGKTNAMMTDAVRKLLNGGEILNFDIGY